METAFGVDLGGYSSKGKSQVARVIRVDNCLTASIIRTSLLQERKGSNSLKEAVEADVKFFAELINNGEACAVDVPIDLQGINEFSQNNKEYLWEATKRPIDYALGALPPLADRIGAVVARMQLIMKHFPNELGKSIFETYPAGSLALLGKKQQYKGGAANWQGSKWKPASGKPPGLSLLFNDLNFFGLEEGQLITDDEFDAIISTVPLLCKPRFNDTVLKHPLVKAAAPKSLPKGYILCGERFWSRIEVNPIE